MLGWNRAHVEYRYQQQAAGESGVEDAIGRESDAAEWMRERLGFEPDEVQRRVLSGTGKRWC